MQLQGNEKNYARLRGCEAARSQNGLQKKKRISPEATPVLQVINLQRRPFLLSEPF